MNLTTMLWSIVSTVLAGSFITVVLLVPEIGTALHLSHSMSILAAAVVAAIIALPIAIGVRKAIK